MAHVAVSEGWVAYCIECERLNSWAVCAASTDDSCIKPVTSVLSSRDPERCGAIVSSPVGLSISSDATLAVALDLDGVHLHDLAISDGAATTTPRHVLRPKRGKSGLPVVKAVGWLAHPHDSLALTVFFADEHRGREIIQVFGEVGRGQCKRTRVLHADVGSITQFATHDPGRIAIVVGRKRQLHLFVRREQVFVHSVLNFAIYSPNGTRPSGYTCTSLAVGDGLVVLGYCLAGFDGGIVDTYDASELKHVARRVFANGIPDALATSGRRVAVGISAWPAGEAGEAGGHDDELPSRLVAFEHGEGEEVVCHGGEAHPNWPSDSVDMGDGQLGYAHAEASDGGVETHLVLMRFER